MTRMLLEWKANVSCADDLGSTALHFLLQSQDLNALEKSSSGFSKLALTPVPAIAMEEHLCSLQFKTSPERRNSF